jgi:hypothetical protein
VSINDDIRANVLDGLFDVYCSIEEDVWSKIRSEVCSYSRACSASYNLKDALDVIYRGVVIAEEGICGNIGSVVKEYVYNSVNK